jgi:hypothetical protein
MNNNRIHDNGINERINDEAWIKEVRRLMAERKVKAPDHLLDAVKQELASQAKLQPAPSQDKPASSQRVRLMPLRSYRWAAAAAIVVAIALPLTLLRRGGTPLVPPSIGGLECGRPNTDSAQSIASAAPTDSKSTMASKSSSIEPSVSSSASVSPYLALNSSSSDTPLTPNTPTPTQHSTLNEPSTKQKRTYNNYHDDNYDYPQPSHQSSHGLSLTAYCGGIGSGSGNGSGMTQGLLMADAEPYGITSVDMLSGTANKNRLVAVDRKKMKAHHNQPIKIGASVGYALTNRWAVNTGVTYSYLSSDFTADGEPKQTQKLHYIGIPLSASYSVLKGHKAEVYITAGGEVEKLVKGTVSSENSLSTNSNEKVKESRPQFSAKAAVGGAYHFTPSLSIYAEPGVSYYFDNHSSVINVYKDRPTSFSLNVGVRYTVK